MLERKTNFEKYYCTIAGGCMKAFDLIIIVFDLFDGANHLELLESKIDEVLFSSVIVSKELSSLPHHSTAKSSNTLAWMQLAGKEEPCILHIALKGHYE